MTVLTPVKKAFSIHWIVVWVEPNVHRDTKKSNKCASSGRKQFPIGVISGFCRDVDQICAILGFHAVKSLDGRITLRWTFRKWYVGAWTGLSWLRIGTGGGHV